MLKIRKYEWEVLKRNLMNSGVNPLDADKIIKDHKQIMDNWYEELSLKIEKGKLSQEDADKKFKQKFWNMCQKLER